MNSNMTLSLPATPIYLRGRTYWPTSRWDRDEVARLHRGGYLSPMEALEANKWLIQAYFYRSKYGV